jgi:hypothetical protein
MKISRFENKVIKNSKAILIAGFVFLIYGLIRYLLIMPAFGINLLTLQPVIIDGSISILFGLGLVIGSLHAIRHKKRLIGEQKMDIIKKRKEAANNPKWLKHK